MAAVSQMNDHGQGKGSATCSATLVYCNGCGGEAAEVLQLSLQFYPLYLITYMKVFQTDVQKLLL